MSYSFPPRAKLPIQFNSLSRTLALYIRQRPETVLAGRLALLDLSLAVVGNLSFKFCSVKQFLQTFLLTRVLEAFLAVFRFVVCRSLFCHPRPQVVSRSFSTLFLYFSQFRQPVLSFLSEMAAISFISRSSDSLSKFPFVTRSSDSLPPYLWQF